MASKSFTKSHLESNTFVLVALSVVVCCTVPPVPSTRFKKVTAHILVVVVVVGL